MSFNFNHLLPLRLWFSTSEDIQTVLRTHYRILYSLINVPLLLIFKYKNIKYVHTSIWPQYLWKISASTQVFFSKWAVNCTWTALSSTITKTQKHFKIHFFTNTLKHQIGGCCHVRPNSPIGSILGLNVLDPVWDGLGFEPSTLQSLDNQLYFLHHNGP